MHILLASATHNEMNSTTQWLENQHRKDITTLITGIGATATAYSLTREITRQKPQLVIQAGIGGSFAPELTPGTVALIGEEVFADLAVIENEALSDMFDLGLTETNSFPFNSRMLSNPYMSRWQTTGLPVVRGATVNMISSETRQIQMIRDKYNPAIESMEGAALHYVCLNENIPFLQLRAVSNFVGERNKASWKMKEAIRNLNEHLQKIIAAL